MRVRGGVRFEVRAVVEPVEVEFFFHGGPVNGQQQFVPLDMDGLAHMQIGVVTPIQTPWGVHLLRSVYEFGRDGAYHWVGDIA